MTAQLDLDLATARRAPRVSAADVAWFVDQLRGKVDWVTTKIKEMARGKIVSFPGSPGYKLLDHCTLAELRRCDAAVRSQTRRMEAQLKPVWRRMHKLELVENSPA